MNRRKFSKTIAIGLSAAAAGLNAQVPATTQTTPQNGAPPPHARRNLKVGHTGITWPGPDGPEQAIKDVGSLGYYGFETFGDILDKFEAQPGGIAKLLDAANLPLVSAYCTFNMIDPAKRSESVDKMVAWGKLIKKNGGRVAVLGPNPVHREQTGYKFADHKTDIVTTVNEVGKRLQDIGITGVLHPHTGMAIETLDESYAVMDSVDTRYVKFGPDIGQLVKGGADPSAVTKLVKDFLPLVQHMHFKDYSGGQYYLGYCPLGFGRVQLNAVLDLMDGREIAGMVMVELDGTRNPPIPALQAACIAKNYLISQGVSFRS
jgi:inosose dehydratase